MGASRNPLKKVASKLKALRVRHEERHRPTGFSFALADRIKLLNPESWDTVVGGGSLFLQRNILSAMEEHLPENVASRYALVCRGDQPVAVVSAQLVDVAAASVWNPAGATPGKPIGNLLKPAARKMVSRLEERLLVAGNLLSWGFHGIAFAPGETAAQVWPGVAEALYRIRRAERLGGQTDFVMVKDLTGAEAHVEELRRFSYRPMATEPNIVLEIDPSWKCYEDYLGALGARYRRNARDQIKKLATSGCKMERIVDLGPHANRLHELYKSVQSRAAVKLVMLPVGYLPALASASGDRFRCTVAMRNEEIVGFVTTLRDGDTAIAYYIGFDREVAAEGLPLYLRLLHVTVSDAIEWGCRRLSLGRTALEPKASLGAKPEPMSVWLRHRVPALNWVIRGMLNGVPHAEAPERNPFKETRAKADS